MNFDKDKAREEFFKSQPDAEKFLALNVSKLRERLKVEKKRSENLAIKKILVEEILAIRELNREVKEEVSKRVEEKKKELELEFRRIRTRDYIHEKLSKRTDYQTMTRERNRLALQKRKGLKRLSTKLDNK